MNKKISISNYFYIMIIFVIYTGAYKLFLYTFIFVLLHELAHILMAKHFGLRIKKLMITPIGQIAIIDKIDTVVTYKKLLIISSGVTFNLIMYIIFSMISGESAYLMKNINLSIALFNLLPIYPLDGGTFLSYLFGGFIGDLKASSIIKKISIYLSFVIIFFGFLQIIFIKYNYTLLILGIFLIKINKNAYIYSFYKNIALKTPEDRESITKIKHFIVKATLPTKDIIKIFSSNYYSIVNVYIKNGIKYSIEEDEVLNYINLNGLNGVIYDILEEKYSKTKE